MFDDEEEKQQKDGDDVFGDTAVKPEPATKATPQQEKPGAKPGFQGARKYPKNCRPIVRLGNSLCVRIPHSFVKNEFLAPGDLLQFDVWPGPFGRRITLHRVVYLPDKENK